jgi:hypothetical protein
VTATQADYDRALAGLGDCRWQHVLVIADAAEDQGDQALADGWRWLADNRRWPTPEFGLDDPARARREFYSVFGWRGSRRPAWKGDTLRLGENFLPHAVCLRLRKQAKAIEEDDALRWPETVLENLGMAARAVGQWLARGGTAAEQ